MRIFRLHSFFCLLVWLAVIACPAAAAIIEKPYFGYDASTTQFINITDSAITSTRKVLAGILGDTIGYKPQIFIRDNLEDFKSLIGSSFPDWGAAAALPYRRMMAIKSPAHFRLGKSLYELIAHEYSHLVLEDRLHHVQPPRWLDEGLAMFVSAEWNWEDNLAISRAVVLNSIIPLREIEMINRFPGGRAQTAYSESFLAVKYFLDTYQQESFVILLDNLRARESIDDAFVAAIGSNYDGFQKEFFDYLGARYNLMSLFGDLYFIWIIFAAIVVVGFVLGYRRRRKYYKKWEEEEKYQSTDFDYGDPDNPEQADDEDKPWA